MPSLLTILCERLNYEIWVPCSQCSPWDPRLHKHLYPLSVNPDWQMALCLHGEFFPQKFLSERKPQNKTLSEEFITVQEQADKIFASRLLKCTWQIFLLARLNLLSVLICIAKKNFRQRFSFPVFWCTKSVKFHFQWGTKRRDQKEDTGNDCDVISGLQVSRKTDFSVIFLLWGNQFAKKWYNSALFIRT